MRVSPARSEKARRNDVSNACQSKQRSGTKRLKRRSGGATGGPKTARPPESGPRSPMQVNMGWASCPSEARCSRFFTSRPTIPHILLLQSPSRVGDKIISREERICPAHCRESHAVVGGIAGRERRG